MDEGFLVILYVATILGFAVSVMFIGMTLLPDRFGMEDMPILLRVTLGVFGALMLLCSLFAVRHGIRVRQALRTASVTPDHVEVETDEGSDSTSYTLVAHLGDEIWAVPAYASKGIDLIERGIAKDIRAWRDPKTGAPIAFRVDGRRVETYPHPMRR